MQQQVLADLAKFSKLALIFRPSVAGLRRHDHEGGAHIDSLYGAARHRSPRPPQEDRLYRLLCFKALHGTVIIESG